MQKYTKEQCQEIAAQYADQTDTVYVTEDGNVFLDNKKDYAVTHARSSGLGLHSFKSSEFKAKGEDKQETGEEGSMSSSTAAPKTPKAPKAKKEEGSK